MPFSPDEFIVLPPVYDQTAQTFTLTCKRPTKVNGVEIDCPVRATLKRRRLDARLVKHALPLTDQSAGKDVRLRFSAFEPQTSYLTVEFNVSFNTDFLLYPIHITKGFLLPPPGGGGPGGGGFIPPTLTIDYPDPDGNFGPPYQASITSDGDFVSATLKCDGGLPIPGALTQLRAKKYQITFGSPSVGATCLLCVTATNKAGESTTVCVIVHIV